MGDTAHDDAFSPDNRILQDGGAARTEHTILGTSYHQCRRGDTGCRRLQRVSLFEQWIEYPQVSGSLGGTVSELSEPMRMALHRGANLIIERFTRCIHEGNIDGSLPASLDPRHTAQTIHQVWLGATLLTKFRHDRSALDGAMLATLHWLQPHVSAASSR